MLTTEDLERPKLIHSWGAKFEQILHCNRLLLFSSLERDESFAI